MRASSSAGSSSRRSSSVDAEGAAPRDALVQPRLLRRARRDHQRAGVIPAAVDLLGRDDLADLADAVGHRALAAAHRVLAAQPRVAPGAAGQAGRGPAAVASGGAEAGDLALDDRDPQIRLQRRQEVGGPEAGEAGTDDRDVAVGVAAERRARRQRLGEGVEPEAARPVAGLEAHPATVARPSRSSTRVPLAVAVSSTMRVANVSRKYRSCVAATTQPVNASSSLCTTSAECVSM